MPPETVVIDGADEPVAPIPCARGYYVGRSGTVYTTHARGNAKGRTGPAKPMRATPNSLGYRYVLLTCDDGRVRGFRVHRLVADAFVERPGSGVWLALHRNGIATDCRAENIYWSDHEQNSRDARAHGRMGGRPAASRTREAHVERLLRPIRAAQLDTETLAILRAEIDALLAPASALSSPA